MKKFLAAASIVALTSTGAFAQALSSSDAEIVRNLVPSADLSMLSAAQVEALSALVSADDIARDPSAAERVRAILADASADLRPGMLTDSEVEELRALVPGADPMLLSQEQAARLSTYFSAPDYARTPNAEQFVREVLGDMTGMPEGDAMLSEVERERIRSVVPDADLGMLTQEQIRALQSFVNSDDFAANASAEEFIRATLEN